MKIVFVVLSLLFAINVAQKAKPVAAAAPAVKPPVGHCYKKVTNCCFKFATCGVQVGSVKVPTKCPVKTCAKKCFNVCSAKVVPTTTRKCYNTLKYTKTCFKHPWGPKVCDKKPVQKESCANYMTSKLTMPCKEVCPIVCSVAIKPCVYYRVFNYPKFCPTLACGKEAVQGNAVSPKVFVSPNGKFIKKSHTPLKK